MWEKMEIKKSWNDPPRGRVIPFIWRHKFVLLGHRFLLVAYS